MRSRSKIMPTTLGTTSPPATTSSRPRNNRAAGISEEMTTSSFPRLHAHLREVKERAVLGQADHDLETDAGQAESGQRAAQATHASAHPGAGPLAGQRGARG